ncbi:related to protein FAM96B [Cephalotrichum gorgonifer]|uniref:Related to protein FAM96B n=1 Tax=Cephalotrichum gorgonifer TaxID=2041049 RepID=A0AAE8MYI6_9PEZI|nr:related to protein FAM96B [Cephalotrichum gorgonifer]
MDKDNANPTILNLSQLPSRKGGKKAAPTGPGTRYRDLIFSRPVYLSSLSDDESDWSGADDMGSDGDFAEEPIDEQEVYDLVATISDPEHPVSLGQLAVVNLPDIHLSPPPSQVLPGELVRVLVEVTPTITHCSLATIIGLGVRVRLEQALPPNYRVDVRVKAGTHSQDEQVNKQLADKERVAAALENQDLKRMLDSMLATCE